MDLHEERHLQFAGLTRGAVRRQSPLFGVHLGIDAPTAGIDALRKISASLREGEHTYHGFNLFSAEDQALVEALVRGEFCIRGLSNKAITTLVRCFLL